MNTVFADTSYFLALLILDDAAHAKAVDFAMASRAPMVTTDWVIVETGNYLSQPLVRPLFLRWLEALRRDPRVTIVESSRGILQSGLELFADRPDKGWSLTDCTSFVVMTQYGLTEAATTDHHFEQAGFTALLK